MSRTLYVASTNSGKLRDFNTAGSTHGIVILPLPGLADIEAPPEDAPTFEGNACEKALYYCQFLPGEIVLADDSGLEVNALDGLPGVRSARYAADAGFNTADTVDANNNLFLLQELTGAAEAKRHARYRCALAAARDGEVLLTVEGAADGTILSGPRGTGGFGYDPLFYLPALKRTMAEIDDQTRWTLSHRGQAFRALLEKLQPALDEYLALRNLDGRSPGHQ